MKKFSTRLSSAVHWLMENVKVKRDCALSPSVDWSMGTSEQRIFHYDLLEVLIKVTTKWWFFEVNNGQ